MQTVVRYSLSGITRTHWLRGFVVLALLLPLLGFVSQDIHLANHPFHLFMGFQFGLQRYLVLVFSWVATRNLWKYDEKSGMQCALRAAGIHPFTHLVAKHIAISSLILGYQLLLSIYTFALTLVWQMDPHLTEEILISSMGRFQDLLAFAWANSLLMILLISLIRWCWLFSGQLLLGYIAGNLFLLTGIMQPVWMPYFQNTQDLSPVFKVFGLTLSAVVPPLWRFDLWWMHQEFPDLPLLPQLQNLSLLAFSWLLIIHFGSWLVSRFKQT